MTSNPIIDNNSIINNSSPLRLELSNRFASNRKNFIPSSLSSSLSEIIVRLYKVATESLNDIKKK